MPRQMTEREVAVRTAIQLLGKVNLKIGSLNIHPMEMHHLCTESFPVLDMNPLQGDCGEVRYCGIPVIQVVPK